MAALYLPGARGRNSRSPAPGRAASHDTMPPARDSRKEWIVSEPLERNALDHLPGLQGHMHDVLATIASIVDEPPRGVEELVQFVGPGDGWCHYHVAALLALNAAAYCAAGGTGAHVRREAPNIIQSAMDWLYP